MSSIPPPVNEIPDPIARGTVRLRRHVGTLRVLTILSLILIVLLAVWSVVGIVSLSSQVSSLEAKVDALSGRLATQASSAADASAPEASTAPTPIAEEPPASADVPAPAGAGQAGAIVVGDPDAAKTVEVYVDYQCPYCQRWETEIGAALMERALQPGSGLAVKQYNMAFLGEASRSLDPAGASARAANAAACMLDGSGVEGFVAINTALFAVTEDGKTSTEFDTASLAALADGLGASAATLECIEQETYVPFVAATTQAAFARGVTGTPTVLVNGKPLQDPFGDPQLLALLQM